MMSTYDGNLTFEAHSINARANKNNCCILNCFHIVECDSTKNVFIVCSLNTVPCLFVVRSVKNVVSRVPSQKKNSATDIVFSQLCENM